MQDTQRTQTRKKIIPNHILIKLLKTSDRKKKIKINQMEKAAFYHMHWEREGKNDNKLLIGNNASHKGRELPLKY